MVNRRKFLGFLTAAITAAAVPINKVFAKAALAESPHPPKGWLFCDGRYLNRKDYPKLFEVIGKKYGGFTEYYDNEVKETFRLPDMRGHVSVATHSDRVINPTSGFRYIIRTENDESLPAGIMAISTSK